MESRGRFAAEGTAPSGAVSDNREKSRMNKRNAAIGGWIVVLVAACGLLAGCGGGGSGDDDGGGGAFQGTYVGTFTGTDAGTWRLVVAGDGAVAGTAHSTAEDLDYVVSGEVDEAGLLTAGLYDGGLYRGTYTGTIAASGAVAGTWSNDDGSDRGTFAGQKQ